MLDSGAYTVSRSNRTIDIDKYAEFVKEHIKLFDNCLNLDVIQSGKKDLAETAKGSYHNWKYLRQQGVNAIPVFHLGTDEKWLERYLKQTDYICIGAIANLDTSQRIKGLDRIWKDYLTDSNGMPKLKVHGLGLTALDIVLRYPWYSVDSSSPSITAGFGQVYVPDITKKEPDYFNSFTMKVSDQANYPKSKMGHGARTFLGQPPTFQKKYRTLFQEHGFELGDVTYQEIRERRSKKHRIDPPPTLFDLTRPSSNKETLANGHMARYLWNLSVWREIMDRLPCYPRKLDIDNLPGPNMEEGEKTTIYIAPVVITYVAASKGFDVLTSFAHVNDKFLKILKGLKT